MSLALVAALLIALAVAAVATPVVSKLARAVDAVDRPNERKVNLRPDMPLLGGLAVALGFFVGMAVAILLLPREVGSEGHLEGYLLGGALLLCLGAWDDRYGVSAFPKLWVQTLVAAVAIAFGFRIDHLTDPFTQTAWQFPTWAIWLSTTVWIVMITNAINLLDGLDGLATGVSAIIAGTLSLIAFQTGNIAGAAAGLALVGALLGFLPYNFPPARIFLGDTGSLFIGYSLALLALDGYQKVTVLTFIVPLLALAVPLLDTGLSILRRLRRRTHIFAADREHMHHRLLDTEGSHRSAVLSIYFLTCCFCILAVSFTRLAGYAAILFLAAVILLTLRLLRNLGFFELDVPPGNDSSASSKAEQEQS